MASWQKGATWRDLNKAYARAVIDLGGFVRYQSASVARRVSAFWLGQWRYPQSAGRKEALLPLMTDTQTTNQNKGADLAGFAAMFEATQAATPNGQIGGEGEIVSGLVVQVNRDSVVVDIGGKSEGVISKSEFVDAVGAFNVKAGDRVDVFIESRESDDGLPQDVARLVRLGRRFASRCLQSALCRDVPDGSRFRETGPHVP